MAATRVLLVSSRTDVSELLQDDPGGDQYELERRSHELVDAADAAEEFRVVLVDLDTTPGGVALGKSLRAARRDLELITIASAEAERLAVESLKAGAFDYVVWPPNEPSDVWSLLARCLKKIAPPVEPEFPAPFGRFRLLGKLGSGGMAEVFLAEQAATKNGPARPCVIKAMHEHLTTNVEFVRMFMDECRITSLLVHPNIVRVVDFGRHGEVPYLVMDYVPGRNLEELERDIRAPFPPALACWVVAEICAGLAHAHTKADANGEPLGIVHRDVNPPNVIVGEEGRVLLTDFGIAKAAHRYYETTSGVLKGKFEYMSPEQAHGQAVDHRADLFSAGLILYELLTYTRPFLAETPVDSLFLIQQCKPKPPSTWEPKLPKALDAIVMKALAREPDDRYPTASAMEADLREFARRLQNPSARDVAMFIRDARAAHNDTVSKPLPRARSTPHGVVPGGAPALETTAARDATAPRRVIAIPRAPREDTVTPGREVTITPASPEVTITPEATRPPQIAAPPFARTVAKKVLVVAPAAATSRGVVPAKASDGEATVNEPRVRTGVQELEIEIPMIPSDTVEGIPQLREQTDIRPRPNLDGPTGVNSDALLPMQPPGALPPTSLDGTVIVPMGPPPTPIEARTPEKSTISGGLFPGEAIAAETRRRNVRFAAIGIGVAILGIIAVPVAMTLGGGNGGTPAPYGTPIVKATTAEATPAEATPIEETTAIAVVTEEATPELTATPTSVAVATPRTTPVAITPRATPTARVIAPTPKPTAAPVRGKGTLSIWVDGWATVELDGKALGVNAPFVGLSLPAGKHVLVLQNQWVRRQMDVTIVAGKETKLSVDLSR